MKPESVSEAPLSPTGLGPPCPRPHAHMEGRAQNLLEQSSGPFEEPEEASDASFGICLLLKILIFFLFFYRVFRSPIFSSFFPFSLFFGH